MFKWAAREELVPVAVHQALATVAGLRKGRTGVRDADPVGPVAADARRGRHPAVPQPARGGLVEFQRLTGCRPGEACRSAVRPGHGRGGLGVPPAAPQDGVAGEGPGRSPSGRRPRPCCRRFQPADPDAPLFSPAGGGGVHAGRGAARKTPRYPSHLARNAGKRAKSPARSPAERYSVTSYGQAVRRAADRANRRRAALAGAGNFDPVPRWHPNQLRHAHGTAVRRRYGLEAAGAALGHAKTSATEVYAERDEAFGRQGGRRDGLTVRPGQLRWPVPGR